MRLLLLPLLLAALGASEPAVAAGTADPAQPPPMLARTAGWRGLLAQPPITVDGIPVRLGISHEATATGDAALLYVAVAEGWSTPHARSGLPCGPVGLVITPPPDAPHVEQAQLLVDHLARLRPAGDPAVELHARAIACDAPGTWRIAVLDSAGGTVATAAIAVAGERRQPWCAMDEDDGLQEMLARELRERALDGGRSLCAILRARPGFPALPEGGGGAWMLLPKPQAALLAANPDSPDVALPVLDPAEHRIAATCARGWLELVLPAGVASGDDLVAEHLLLRWWRGGRPWFPDPDRARVLKQEMMQLQRLQQEADGPTRVRLPIDWLDVPPGTALAVQVLWSRPAIADQTGGGLHSEDAVPTTGMPILASGVVPFIAP